MSAFSKVAIVALTAPSVVEALQLAKPQNGIVKSHLRKPQQPNADESVEPENESSEAPVDADRPQPMPTPNRSQKSGTVAIAAGTAATVAGYGAGTLFDTHIRHIDMYTSARDQLAGNVMPTLKRLGVVESHGDKKVKTDTFERVVNHGDMKIILEFKRSETNKWEPTKFRFSKQDSVFEGIEREFDLTDDNVVRGDSPCVRTDGMMVTGGQAEFFLEKADVNSRLMKETLGDGHLMTKQENGHLPTGWLIVNEQKLSKVPGAKAYFALQNNDGNWSVSSLKNMNEDISIKLTEDVYVTKSENPTKLEPPSVSEVKAIEKVLSEKIIEPILLEKKQASELLDTLAYWFIIFIVVCIVICLFFLAWTNWPSRTTKTDA